MKIVGVDPSTKTGVASVDGTAKVCAHAEINFKDLKGLERAIRIGEAVAEFAKAQQAKFVAIEGYAFGNHFTLGVLVEIGTMIRYKLREAGIEYIEVGPTAMKKFVSGSGNSKKDKMMLAVYKLWGFEGTDNEADAVGLAQFGAALLGYTPSTKEQAKVLQEYRKTHEDKVLKLIKGI